jgi:hypothetical protein
MVTAVSIAADLAEEAISVAAVSAAEASIAGDLAEEAILIVVVLAGEASIAGEALAIGAN